MPISHHHTEMPIKLNESNNEALYAKCPDCGRFIEAEPVALGMYALAEIHCATPVIPIIPGGFNVGLQAYHRITKIINIVEAVSDETISLSCLDAFPRNVLQYTVNGNCIVDAFSGGVLYDCLAEMPMLTRLRLAEIATQYPDWDWERSRHQLEAERYAICHFANVSLSQC